MEPMDLGNGYSARPFGWAPDREIYENAMRYRDVPDIDEVGLIITCPHGDGAIHFDTPEVRQVFPEGPFWKIVWPDPLTLEPSVLRRECGCHGHIKEGQWVPA